jgi:hypothetical protein
MLFVDGRLLHVYSDNGIHVRKDFKIGDFYEEMETLKAMDD